MLPMRAGNDQDGRIRLCRAIDAGRAADAGGADTFSADTGAAGTRSADTDIPHRPAFAAATSDGDR